MSYLVPYFCKSPACQAAGRFGQIMHLPKGDDAQCPTCGTGRYLERAVQVHLLVHDPEGKIAGSDFSPLARTPSNTWNIACERGKSAVQKHGGQPSGVRFTTLPDAVTCRDCLDVIESFKRIGHNESGLWIPHAVDELE